MCFVPGHPLASKWNSKRTCGSSEDARFKVLYQLRCIKGNTRKSRSDITIEHQLSSATPLPPQTIAFGSSSTKLQLIGIIERSLIDEFKKPGYQHKLIITGNEITTLVHLGISIECDDIRTSQEEADVIIIYQLLEAICTGVRCIEVVCDDTGVFILLMHFCHKYQLDVDIYMEESSGERAIISIPGNAENIKTSLNRYALSGCDTVPEMSGIGKKSVLNTLRKNANLPSLVRSDVPLETVINESCEFVAACYDYVRCTIPPMEQKNTQKRLQS